jgi:excisionase family DNA binding protein
MDEMNNTESWMNGMKPEMTPREMSQLLGWGLDYTYKLLWAGKINAVKREGRWVIPSEEIAARMRQREARVAA